MASMPRLAPLALVTLMALAAVPATAAAGALGLIVAGEPAKQPVIETTLEPWLKARGYQVQIGIADVKVAEKLVDCFIINDQRCPEPMVAKLGLPSTLFVMVEVHHDTKANTDEVTLTGWLYGDKGQWIASQSVSCQACRNDTLGPTVEDLAKALFAVAGEGSGRVRITSTPSGAAVLIDGARVGATPWEQGLRIGVHTVTIELPGHRSHTARVTVEKDDTEFVETALAPIGGPSAPGRAKWPLAIVGVGVGAIAAGVAMIVVDEDCGPGPGCPAPMGTTETSFTDSAAVGWGAVGAGVILTGVGTLLYLRSSKPVRTTPTAWLDPGRGGGVGVVGRF